MRRVNRLGGDSSPYLQSLITAKSKKILPQLIAG